MEKARPIGHNVLILTIGAFIGSLAYAILGLLIARVVGPVGYGEYVLAFTIAYTFTYGFMLGMDIIIPRELAQDPSILSSLLPSVIIPATIWSILLVLLIYSFGYLLHYSREVLSLLLFSAPIVALQALTNLIRAIYRGMERMQLDALSQAVNGVLVLLLGGSVLLLTHSILGTTVAYLVSLMLGIFISLYLAFRLAHGKKIYNHQLIRRILTASLPLGVAVIIAQSGQNITMLILGKYVSTQGVGFYGAALGCALMLRPLHMAYSSAFLPRLSAQAIISKNTPLTSHENGLRFALMLGVPIGIATTMLAPLLITILYGKQYIEGSQALRLLGMEVIFLFINTYLWQVFTALGKEKTVLVIACISILIAVGLSFLLTPHFGIIGTAIADLSREGVQMILFLTVLRYRWKTLSIKPQNIFSIGIASLILVVCLWAVRLNSSLISLLFLAGGMIVYGMVLFLCGAIKKNELSSLIPSRWMVLLKRRESK
ncbi:MAG: flippase [Candidatus Helarchaeota archaeon]|nr:flippase [Candidatus Helarchaeota archaeon]